MTITITPGQIRYIKTMSRRVFGSDDAAYREMLKGQAGVTSCKDLKGPKIDLVIRHLEKCLGQRSAGGDARTTDRMAGQLRLIRALWGRVSYAPPGQAREKALRKFLGSRFQVGTVEWLTPEKASAVIEALKKMVQRQGSGARGQGPEKKGEKYGEGKSAGNETGPDSAAGF